MSRKKVLITIAKDGEVEGIEPVGYTGPNACYKATAPFEKVLNEEARKDEKTPDYYKDEETTKVRETE